MRITRIKGENIASLAEPFDIDFTAPPLSEVDIFAITGPTGSGKSSLLDAVCLALYDATPRYESSQRRGDTFIDSSGEEESSTSTKQLLHRGAAAGYAEVSFIIHDIPYTARWELRRSRGKSTGRLQEVQMSLLNHQTGELYQDKKTKVKEQIVSVVGLTFNQFVRAVLLAQGDFSAFLRAKDEEKGEILMRITDTDIYKEISQTIFLRAKEKSTELKELEEKYNLQELPSKEEIDQLEKQHEAQQQNIADKEKIIGNLSSQLVLLKEYSQLTSSLEEAKSKLEGFIPSIADITSREEKLKKNRKIASLYIEKSTLERLQSTFTSLQNDFQLLQERKATLEDNATTFKKQIAKEKESLLALQKSYTDSEPLRTKIKEKEKQIVTINGEITQLKHRTEELQNEFNQQEKQENNILSTLQRLSQKSQEIEAWMEQHHEAKLHFLSLPTLSAQLELLHSHKEYIMTTKETLQKEQETLQQQRDTLHTVTQELEKLEKALPENIYTLRNQLVEGDPCPVCGSTSHPFAHTAFELLDMSIDNLTIHRQKLKNEESDLLQKLPKQEQIIANKEEIKEEKESEFFHLLQQKAPLYLLITGKELTQDSDFIASSKEISALYEELQSVEQEKNQLNILLSNSQNELNNCRQTLERNKTLLATYSEEIEEKNKLVATFKREIVEKLGVSSLEIYERNFLQQREEIKERLNSLQEKKVANHTALQEVAEQSTHLTETKLPQQEKEIQEAREKLATQLHLANVSFEEIHPIENSFLEDEEKAIQSLKKQEHTYRANLSQRESDWKAFIEKNSSFQEIKELSTILEEIELCKKNQETINAELEENKKSFISLSVKLNEIERKKKEQNRLAQRIEGTKEEERKWQRLNYHFGSSDGKKFNIQAQAYTLSTLIQFANLQLRRFAPRYTLQRVPKSLALEVIDNEMMQQHRSVHSLSGGETFLVSLALSLALSEISSYNLRIESLFIDEGFGSLDEKTLDAALRALQQLNRSGKKVGIISHVDYITSQLPVRIEVKKSGHGESKVAVVAD